MSMIATGATVSADQLIALKAYTERRLISHKLRHLSTPLGQHLSRNRERGLEFSEVRQYQSGDDIRTIDWRVTARTGRAHTRLYAVEKERPVIVLCDQRPAMRFGTKVRFKSVQAANIAALIIWYALARGDRVGGIVARAAGHDEVRSSRSQQKITRLIGLIAQATQHSPTRQTDSTPTLAQLLLEIRHVAKPGTSIYLLSDFYDWCELCDQHIMLIARHCQVTIVFITDILEQNLPLSEWLPMSNGKQQILLHGRIDGPKVVDHFNRRVAVLQDRCRKFRMGLQSLTTTDDPLDIIQTMMLRERYGK